MCTPCAGGSKRPAGDDSSGADTSCSCKANEHVKETQNNLHIAVGFSGKILTATDPTGTWTERTSDTSNNLFKMAKRVILT